MYTHQLETFSKSIRLALHYAKALPPDLYFHPEPAWMPTGEAILKIQVPGHAQVEELLQQVFRERVGDHYTEEVPLPTWRWIGDKANWWEVTFTVTGDVETEDGFEETCFLVELYAIQDLPPPDGEGKLSWNAIDPALKVYSGRV